jgi:hypothetical protein
MDASIKTIIGIAMILGILLLVFVFLSCTYDPMTENSFCKIFSPFISVIKAIMGAGR